MAKISNQLKTFFEETERYAKASPVLKKSAHLKNISFYKNYYRGLSFYHKGMEKRKEAEGKGEGMSIAGGLIKYSMGLLGTAKKLADTSTAGAVDTRLATISEEYEEL